MHIKYLTVIVAVISSTVILLNAYFLRLGMSPDPILSFWLPLFILAFLMFFTSFTINSKYPLILIMIFAFTLHMLQFIRQPPNLIWSVDSIYVHQAVANIIKTGYHTFGFGTGMTPIYTYYPLFPIFLSALSSITSLSLMVIVKYSMAILNLVTLLGLYMLLSLLKLDFKSKNIILCIFNLNPMFHFFNSYAHAESFAIIFYPIILLYALRQSQSKSFTENSFIAIFFLIVVTISHHFTSYMTTLALVAVPILLYIISKKNPIRIESQIFSLILPLTWLTFVSYSLFSIHLERFVEVLRNLTELHFGPYVANSIESSITFYPSVFAIQLTQVRNFLLVAVTFFGFLFYFRHKEGAYRYFGGLLLLSSAITFVSMFIVDWSQIGSVPRTRFIEFLFYPIAIFFALGTIKISQKLKHIINGRSLRRHSIKTKFITLLLVTILTFIFVPATIFNAFPRYNYDPTYSPVFSEEYPVAPESQYYFGIWLSHYSDPIGKRVFAGSLSVKRYVIGYGLQEKWDEEIFNVSSIKEGMSQTWFGFTLYYVVNDRNFYLPDSYGRKMNSNITDFLEGNFNRMYDNGIIESYMQ